MTQKPESLLVDRIRKMLKKRGIYSIKIHGDPYQPAGEQDLICCAGGRFISLEVKMPGIGPKPLQRYTIDRVRRAGGIATTVHSVGEVEALLDGIGH